ncbi:MAG: biotin--[acetyl-CoA-carboxylase] ligase [Acidobacteria bacterium]|nr:MAG: biotin--[acetyl-CoA-carboxylase] ligase [Acidobacteriota bacterium]
MMPQEEARKLDRFIQLLLANATVFVSGEKLAEALKVSRMTICNWVHHLQKQEMVIEIKPKIGYRLTQVPDLLLPQLIRRELRTKVLGKSLYHYFQVESTNDVAHQLAQQGVAEGGLIVAEEQTQGRGRLGRDWYSERRVGIYLSLILRPILKPRHATIINLAAAVAVSQAIESTCSLSTDIKWPNDVLVNNKKCSGILTEMSADLDQIKYMIVGIGINVNHQSFPKSLQGRASSLFLEGGRRFSRIEIILALLRCFEDLYLELQKQGNDAILERWIRRSSFARGKEVSVDLGDKKIHGTTIGLGKEGTLRVKLSGGQIEDIMSGDVVIWDSVK